MQEQDIIQSKTQKQENRMTKAKVERCSLSCGSPTMAQKT